MSGFLKTQNALSRFVIIRSSHVLAAALSVILTTGLAPRIRAAPIMSDGTKINKSEESENENCNYCPTGIKQGCLSHKS